MLSSPVVCSKESSRTDFFRTNFLASGESLSKAVAPMVVSDASMDRPVRRAIFLDIPCPPPPILLLCPEASMDTDLALTILSVL
jgi:hypothetical protein